MWRYFTPAAAFLVLGALFAYALVRIQNGTMDPREIKSPLIGKPAPTFVLPTVADKTVNFDSAREAVRRQRLGHLVPVLS